MISDLKIPKRLDFSRACFYELPDDQTAIELNGYEIYYRARYPAVFLSRSGPRFYFQFGTAMHRDLFIRELEASAQKSNLIVERQTIYR